MKKEFIKRIMIVSMVSITITNMYCISASAKWSNDSKNNWNWIEGEVKATGWKEIDKDWYYFNEDGTMITGWLNYNGNWYSLSSSGVMETGWKEIDGNRYHFNMDGVMSIGWIEDNGVWYFTNSTGKMETGTLGIDGKVYNFSDSGAMINDEDVIQEIQSGPDVVSNVKGNEDNNEIHIAYVATNNDLLNVRQEAKISSNIIGTLEKGTEVKIIDDERNEFYPISINGTEGWVSSKWISFEKPKDTDDNINSNNNADIDSPIINSNEVDLKDDSLDKDIIRDEQPSLDDEHYYSDNNLFYKIRLSPPFFSRGKLIKGNCTWYAWGRAWEITGSKPEDAGFIGNAYEWWEANKESGKYQYGSEPRVGSIAVWKSDLPNSGNCGHVAVVEKIEDGEIYISESMWHGVTFQYRDIYETNYLYGYIYLDKPNY